MPSRTTKTKSKALANGFSALPIRPLMPSNTILSCSQRSTVMYGARSLRSSRTRSFTALNPSASFSLGCCTRLAIRVRGPGKGGLSANSAAHADARASAVLIPSSPAARAGGCGR